MIANQEALLSILHDLIMAEKSPIKEFDLVKKLGAMEWPVFAGADLQDELVLFRVHFMLFHLLYRLRDRMRASGEGDLMIHCLGIEAKPWHGGKIEQGLENVDPMRDYYLDLTHLEQATQQSVKVMIDQFWDLFSRYDKREEALAVLGLVDPVHDEAIRARYRLLAFECHPDQGGDAAQFRQITEALGLLLPKVAPLIK